VSESRVKGNTIVVLSPSTDLYGSDRSLLAAIPALAEQHDVLIAVPQEGPMIARARELGARVEVVPDFALRRRHLRPAAFPFWLKDLASAQRRVAKMVDGRPAMVYVNTLAVALLPVLKRSFGAPVVVHVRERATGSQWEQKILNASVARYADLVVANSAFTASTLTGVASHRIEVVHNGTDVPDAPAPEAPLDGPLEITCVGRLHPKKGQWVLLEAVRRAVEDGADWRVHLFGNALAEHADLETSLRRQAELPALEGRVEFHGYVADLEKFYERRHVSVIPSVLPEEFSRVCAESQARALPVVATGPGGISEVMVHGETGFIVEPDNPTALRRSLETLDADRLLARKMGAAGRQRMKDRFTEEHYADGIRRVVHRATAI